MTTNTPSSFANLAEAEVFKRLEEYPWTSDLEFQNGLQAILGPDPNPKQAEHLTLRAQCFFFSRQVFEVVGECQTHVRSIASTTFSSILMLTSSGTRAMVLLIDWKKLRMGIPYLEAAPVLSFLHHRIVPTARESLYKRNLPIR